MGEFIARLIIIALGIFAYWLGEHITDLILWLKKRSKERGS